MSLFSLWSEVSLSNVPEASGKTVSPCPFCGSAELNLVTFKFALGYFVACPSCGCTGAGEAETVSGAIWNWNNRVSPACSAVSPPREVDA